MRRSLLAAGFFIVVLPFGLVAGIGTSTTPWTVGFNPASLTREIPEPMLSAYIDAAEKWHIDWALLAAIGKLECDHGRYRAPGCWPQGTVNQAGARGPMQFLGSTWRSSAGRYDLDVAGPPARNGNGYGTDGDGDGIADPWRPSDAVHSAARYLVALGGRADPRLAAKGYNAGPANSDPTAGEGYATSAVELIAHYHALAGAGVPGTPEVATVSDGYALPFDVAGLQAVTAEAVPARDPEWQLAKPHHSGRVGVDISLQVGTPLYALVDGEVVWAGDSGNCGYGLAIRNAGQHASITYCHLSALHVTAGQEVAAGEPVGRSGGRPGIRGAGNSTGPHLHLHIDTPSGRRCPQALLLGLWRGWPVPTIAALRTSGCTYTSVAPAAQSPVPIPPDLAIPGK